MWALSQGISRQEPADSIRGGHCLSSAGEKIQKHRDLTTSYSLLIVRLLSLQREVIEGLSGKRFSKGQ